VSGETAQLSQYSDQTKGCTAEEAAFSFRDGK
jgi:hypothetical protein